MDADRPTSPFEGHGRRDDPTPAARNAAVDLGRRLGLRVDDPVVLADGFALMVHLAPSPVVARVPTFTGRVRPSEQFLTRELAVLRWLAEQDAPTLRPTSDVDPGLHHHRDHHIALYELLPVRPDLEVTTADCLRLLGELHRVLRDYPGDLPVFGPTANDLPLCLAELERAADLLGDGRLRAIESVAHRLEAFRTAPPGDLQPVHGDVHPGNIVSTAEGPVWIDFEDVCLAPREWDLALLSWDTDADLSAHHPDPDVLRQCQELRALHILVWMIRFRGEQGSGPGYDELITGCLELLPETRSSR